MAETVTVSSHNCDSYDKLLLVMLVYIHLYSQNWPFIGRIYCVSGKGQVGPGEGSLRIPDSKNWFALDLPLGHPPPLDFNFAP